MRSLPVIEITLKSIKTVRENYISLFRVGAPFIVFVLIWFSILHTLNTGAGIQSPLLFVVFFLVFAATSIMAMVNFHRVFLLDESTISQTRPLRFSGRELRFLGWWIVVGTCALIISILIAMFAIPLLVSFQISTDNSPILMSVIELISMFPVCYVIARLSLLFPATALDRRPDLGWAWATSKGNSIRLTFLVGIIPLVTSEILDLIPPFESIFYSVFIGIIWSLVVVVEIGLLSLSYRWFVEKSRES